MCLPPLRLSVRDATARSALALPLFHLDLQPSLNHHTTMAKSIKAGVARLSLVDHDSDVSPSANDRSTFLILLLREESACRVLPLLAPLAALIKRPKGLVTRALPVLSRLALCPARILLLPPCLRPTMPTIMLPDKPSLTTASSLATVLD